MARRKANAGDRTEAPQPPVTGELELLPIRRQTLTSMTADAIRERILRGRYPEGEPLRQDAIGVELGVSRIPVREALRQLEAEGLVTFNPHRGAVVSTLSLKQIRELFELRAEIEGDLIRRAVPYMKPEDHARADEILDAYEAALRSGQVAVWGALEQVVAVDRATGLFAAREPAAHAPRDGRRQRCGAQEQNIAVAQQPAVVVMVWLLELPENLPVPVGFHDRAAHERRLSDE